MKKIISFCFLFVFMIAMVGCGSNNTSATTSTSQSSKSASTISSTPKRAARQDILSLSKSEVRKQNTDKKLQQFGKDNGGITPISLKIEEGKAGNFSIDEIYDYMSKEIDVVNETYDGFTFSMDKSDNSIRFKGLKSNSVAGELEKADFTLNGDDYVFIDDFILSSCTEEDKYKVKETRGMHIYVFCDKKWQKMSEKTASEMHASEWNKKKDIFMNNECMTLHFVSIPIITDDDIRDDSPVVELWNKDGKFVSYINKNEGYREGKRASKDCDVMSYKSKVICYSEIIVTQPEKLTDFSLDNKQNEYYSVFSLPTK